MWTDDAGNLTAVLTLGSEHTSKESIRIWETKPDQGDRALDSQHVYVFTVRTPAALEQAGIRVGTRVCIDRSKRTSVDIGGYIGSYFLDDRAAVTALLRVARQLHQGDRRPAEDVYLVFTLCLPSLSTHGFEVIARDAIDDMAAIVVNFLLQPQDGHR